MRTSRATVELAAGRGRVVIDPSRCEADVLEALALEPDLGGAARADAVLILSGDGERLLFASRTVRALLPSGMRCPGPVEDVGIRRAFQALASRVDGGLPRFERVRLDGGRLALPVVVATKRVALASGETGVLITVPSTRGNGTLRRAPDELGVRADEADAGVSNPTPFGSAPLLTPEPMVLGHDPSEIVPHLRGRGVVRFLWEADAAYRLLFVSPALAAVVGEESAEIVGRVWSDLVGDAIADDPGVRDDLAGLGTWSGRTARWRIAGTPVAVAVDLAGTPVLDAHRTVAGFRGFGLIRTGALTWWLPPEAPGPGERAVAAAGPAPVGPPEPATAAVEDGTQAPHVAEASVPADGQPMSDMEAGSAAPAEPRQPAPPEPAPSLPTAPRLSDAERNAFREIARALGARLATEEPADAGARRTGETMRPAAAPAGRHRPVPASGAEAGEVLDGLPIGLLIHRGDEPLFANRALLELSGHDGLDAVRAAGGTSRLLHGREVPPASADGAFVPVTLAAVGGAVAAEARATIVRWGGSPANALLVRRATEAGEGRRPRPAELGEAEARARELSAILDTATDGVVVLDASGRILSLNRSAEALFGFDATEVEGEPFAMLLAPESHAAASAYLDGLRANGVRSLINDGRDVVGRVRQGGFIPLFMTLGRVGDGPKPRFCAVLRDVTALEKARGELAAARAAAETALARQADLLAKISHELRTPLNAMVGFAEVMLEERFGAVGNERYRDYLQHIDESGRRVVSTVDRLLDLARVEAGRMELAFAGLSLNELVGAVVAALQPQAATARVVVRTSFAPKLPEVVADAGSLRQIVANLLSNAIRFTASGGQVIVSTALTDRGEVACRVRDTGTGMTAEEAQAALDPFRTLSTARPGGGPGLGLPLAKALAEANRATFQLSSARNEGTLAEVLFPPARVLAFPGAAEAPPRR